jgi:DNA-binding response OmpR family regulator
MRLLIVEDDEVLAQALQNVLTEQDDVVDVAQDGEEGRDFALGFT